MFDLFLSLTDNVMFWIAFSFAVMVFLGYKPLGALILQLLDKHAEKVKTDLDEAQNLVQEAQTLLASYQVKQENMANDLAKVTELAEYEAKQVLESTAKHLELALAKRQASILHKVESYNNRIKEEVLSKVMTDAIAAVTLFAHKHLDQNTANKLLQASLNSPQLSKLANK